MRVLHDKGVSNHRVNPYSWGSFTLRLRVLNRFYMFLLVTTAISMTILGLLNLARLLGTGKTTRRNPGVASSLLERASAIEGQNPREANELRQSALAFLSVAR